ncbi:hypothetical protein [Psychrobacter celer]|uniref:hypothetical protein n=1 Tax=Psychrobacter celer TaxID=306572 RepID=UPI003FCF1347
MTSSSHRNERAKLYITEQIEKARHKSESDFLSLTNYNEISLLLTSLIDTKSKGFRGVVATALTGMYLDPSFDPLNNFYACNPRSIFENGIFFAFQGQIPCGKSDPLNVAKNQYVLNEDWAAGKRPESAALAVVHFLEAVVDNSSDRETLISFYFFRLVEYAEKVKAIDIKIPDSNSLSQQEIGHRLAVFVYTYPESGTTPQYVASLLFKAVYEKSSLIVVGGEESVFGTNTTSRKAADIWIEENNKPVNLYEITVKKIDVKRLNDSLHALNDMNMIDSNIHFICRLPEDVATLSILKDGTYNYQGKKFNFIDLRGFILTLVALLTTKQLKSIINELTSFIEDVERPISTKDGWNNIFNTS